MIYRVSIIDGTRGMELKIMFRVILTLSCCCVLITTSSDINGLEKKSSTESIPIWSQYKYNATHSGMSPYALTKNHTVAWKFDLHGYPQFGAPAIGSDGTIYMSTRSIDLENAHLYAINPNGTEKWSFTFDGYNGTPSVALSTDGVIYARGTVTDKKLYAITSDGKEKWNITFDDYGCGAITIDNDGVVYIFASSELSAIAPDGSIKWRSWFPYRNEWLCNSPSVGADGRIYAQAGGEFRILDHTGELCSGDISNLTKGSEGYYFAPSVSNDGEGYFAVSEIDSTSTRHGHLFAIAHDGFGNWYFRLDDDLILASPSVDASSIIYFGTELGHLYAMKDGNVLWKFKANGAIRSSPIITPDGTLLFGSVDGSFYAIKNATLLWKTDTNGSVDSTAAMDDHGNVYFGSEDGYLYAIGEVHSPSEGPKDDQPGNNNYNLPATVEYIAIGAMLIVIYILGAVLFILFLRRRRKNQKG
jgi:outer membrane protein assembly factor BamB